MVQDRCRWVRWPRASGGFTLVELMISMVIATVGIMAVAQLQLVTTRGNAYARERTEAMEIASGVAEELRAIGLGWTDAGPAGSTTYASVFLAGSPYELQVTATPALGVDLDPTNLRSIMSYAGQTIASGPAFADAYLINVRGLSFMTDPTIASAGARYRVHYIAHEARTDPLEAPRPDLLRITVFVSWDSRDFGDQTLNWATGWQNQANFFRRHMVSVTFLLGRLRAG